MTRLRAETVEVHRRDADPDQFLWRDRLYVVREVLARWTETGQWWRAPALTALSSGDASDAVPAALETRPIPPSPKWAQRAWGEPAPDVGAAVGPASLDDGERDWWRVEADSGRAHAARQGGAAGTALSGGTGVYDLCFDGATGSWTLARVLD